MIRSQFSVGRILKSEYGTRKRAFCGADYKLQGEKVRVWIKETKPDWMKCPTKEEYRTPTR